VNFGVVRLLRDLCGEDRQAKEKALIALAKLGPRAADAVPILTRIATSTADPKISSIAVHALGRIGKKARSSVGPLCKLLLAYKEHLFGRTIAKALAQIGDPRALPTLYEAKNTRHGMVNKEAWNAIRRIEAQSTGSGR
jgi:HEAT repeat protein